MQNLRKIKIRQHGALDVNIDLYWKRVFVGGCVIGGEGGGIRTKKKKQNGKIESKHMYSVLKLDKSKKSLTEMRVSGGVCYVLLG
jgi:hypothetical protein